MLPVRLHTQGQGRPLVLLHGWGMNSLIWQPILPRLAKSATVTCIDLPGHGQNDHLPLGSLHDVTARLADSIPDGAVVMGWSLGGLVAQSLAHALPERIAALVLVASTPRFVATPDWQPALPHETLDNFAHNLQTDYASTVKRFFALQFLNTRTDNRTVADLHATIMTLPASPAALVDGLDILRTADFSTTPVTQPCLWLLGRLDKLIPVALAETLPTLGYKEIIVIKQAAHVPFVTHADSFMQHVGAFLDAH